SSDLDAEQDGFDQPRPLDRFPDVKPLEVRSEIDVLVTDHVHDLPQGERLGADPDLAGIPRFGFARCLTDVFHLDVGGLVLEELFLWILVALLRRLFGHGMISFFRSACRRWIAASSVPCRPHGDCRRRRIAEGAPRPWSPARDASLFAHRLTGG